jgi:glycosyltransferase involved in cell wall biosynthesis
MRIAQIAGPLERVPPERYGGIERVVGTLTEELVRRGHDVTLFAPGGSRTSARLVPVVPEPAWGRTPPFEQLPYVWMAVLGAVLRRVDHFDILHSHLEFFGFPLARAIRGRVVSTMHGRQDIPEAALVHQEFPEVPLVSISDSQRAPVPHANWLATVHHGIELGEFPFQPQGGRYLAFLGRISPEKGLDIAIRVAAQTGMPLKIAARRPRQLESAETQRDRKYYEDQILPLAREHDVEFLGEIGGTERVDFLGNAAALLFPVRWPEPFGLVMAEALACGTPVVGLRNGSVPEVIEDGVTGFVRDSEEELMDAVARVGEIDRRRCRAEAERRFSPTAFADRYEQVYARMVSEQLAGNPVGSIAGHTGS